MRLKLRTFIVNAGILAASIGLVGRTVAAQATPAAGAASLVGAVRDSSGTPIPSAEIILRENGKDLRSVRANDRGEFALGNVQPGAYTVWFRRLGYTSVDFNWAARWERRDSLTIKLQALPRALNAVVVRESEDKMMKGNASLLGLVIDSRDSAVAEASVDLVGADRGGVTRDNGGFLFKPIQPGPYVVRVRKVGYAPQMVTMNLQDGEDREVIVRLRQLATNLDPVMIAAQSGYGLADKEAMEFLDRRLRWRGGQNMVLGPDEMLRYKDGGIGEVAKAKGIQGIEQQKANRANRPKSIMPQGSAKSGPANLYGAGGLSKTDIPQCILINGKWFEHGSLDRYGTNETEIVEIYPSRSEWTGTVEDKMRPPCQKSADGSHPTWYVIWLKGNK